MTIYYFKLCYWNGQCWQARAVGRWPAVKRLQQRGEAILALGD
jgi:hypothetical protein